MGSSEDKREVTQRVQRQEHSSAAILIRSGNENPGRGMMGGSENLQGEEDWKREGEINGIRSLYGFYSPLICCRLRVQ